MYIAIDIGGTKTDIAFYKNKNLNSQTFLSNFKTEQNYEEEINKIIQEIKNGNPNKIKSIIVSNPGTISKEGELLEITNLPDYDNKPLRKDLQQEFNTKVFLIQDSTCSAIAELVYGNIEKAKKAVYLILGTGLGGAIINISKDAKEITPMEPCGMIVQTINGRKHNICKTNGLLETYTGGGSIENFYKIKLAEAKDTDPVWDEITDYLAAGINNLNCILKPDVVVIGGGIGLKRQKALKPVITKIKKYNEFVEPPKIEFTQVEGNSSLIGALAVNFVKNLKLNN